MNSYYTFCFAAINHDCIITITLHKKFVLENISRGGRFYYFLKRICIAVNMNFLTT